MENMRASAGAARSSHFKAMIKQVLAGAGLVAGCVLLAGHAALAEPISPDLFNTFQSGMITGLNDNATIVEIDHRSYKLSSDRALQDRRGQPLEPADLVVQAEVKFHVKKESTDTIDKMVVFFPR